MDFAPNEQQRMLIDTVQKFVRQHLVPLEAQVESDDILDRTAGEKIFQLSSELGLYAMNIPTQYGGGGLSTVDWMLVEEQFGYTSDILIRRAFGNVYEILLAGSEQQIQRWLLPSVKGERTFSIAFTENTAGSDMAGIRTRAQYDGNGWRLNGSKTYISDAHYSDFFVVTAVTDPAAGARGISTFIVDKAMPGVSIGPNQPMMGLRGTSHAELFFENVLLYDQHLLGKPGEGLKLAMQTLGRVRMAQICARAIGKAVRVLNLAIEHARSREQFGRAIGEFQLVQQHIADSAMEINATRLALLHTAWLVDQGHDARANIAAVKVQSSEMLGKVVDRALQVFGGAGYCKSLPLERFYRDARIFRIFDGTSEIHRGIVAKHLLAGDSTLYEMS